MTTACARYVISALVVVAFGKFCNYCYYRPEVYFQVKPALCVDFEQCNYWAWKSANLKSLVCGRSKLASLFGMDRASHQGGNESLTYTAPKEPKKSKIVLLLFYCLNLDLCGNSWLSKWFWKLRWGDAYLNERYVMRKRLAVEKAKQRCVMGIGMCLYAQLVQMKNKQCKCAITGILQFIWLLFLTPVNSTL